MSDTFDTFLVTFDRRIPFLKRLAEGKFGFIHPAFCKADDADFPRRLNARNMPSEGTGGGVIERDVLLVPVPKHCCIRGRNIGGFLDEKNVEPLGLEWATAFGAQHPDVQRQTPVLFTLSRWQKVGGGLFVPCLGDWGVRGRYLSLTDWEEIFTDINRIAAVPKGTLTAVTAVP